MINLVHPFSVSQCNQLLGKPRNRSSVDGFFLFSNNREFVDIGIKDGGAWIDIAVLDCVLARQYTIVASVVSCVTLGGGAMKEDR